MLSTLITSIVIFIISLPGTFYVKDHHFRIVSQNEDFTYVSPELDEVTLFGHPFIGEDTIGLLAHNTGAGRYFFSLSYGEMLRIDNHFYEVREVEYFIDTNLDDPRLIMTRRSTREVMTGGEIFNLIYIPKGRLILQTCTSDGLMFVIAYPIEPKKIFIPLISANK